MRDAWRRLDLQGGGLQHVNRMLAARLRRRARAYSLLAVFPLGLHRDYLADPRGGWLYRGASALALASLSAGQSGLAATIAALEFARVMADIAWIDRRIPEINKRLRMDAMLGRPDTAPNGFRGRTDSAPVQPPERDPESFSAREAELRAASRRNPPSASDRAPSP